MFVIIGESVYVYILLLSDFEVINRKLLMDKSKSSKGRFVLNVLKFGEYDC